MEWILYACSRFWKDVDELRKNASKKSLFETSLTQEQFTSSDIEEKLDSIQILRAIYIYIQNTIDEPKKAANLLDRQPFLDRGYSIYKMRYAADGKGQSSGLRIIYAVGKNSTIVLICIKFKNSVENESSFEKEILCRMKDFLEINGEVLS